VEQVVAYQSLDVQQPDEEIAAALAAGRIDFVAVTSSAIAQSLARMFGDSLRRAHLASISPITSAALRSLGFPPHAEATQYTMAGVVEAILKGEG
jgi:uroporphyrinogen III methyltransferase/synthase